MSEFRLWYPQLDINDCIRRVLLLLKALHGTPVYEERLHVLDFYLANPPLLHKTRLPLELRKRVNELGIQKLEKHFLSFPTPQILFARMEALQTQAVRNLAAKEFIDVQSYRSGMVCLSDSGQAQLFKSDSMHADILESNIIDFLANELSELGRDKPGGLKSHTGLWRITK